MRFPVLSAFQVDHGMRVGTLLRVDPNQWGSVLVAVGIDVKPGIMSLDGSLPSEYGLLTLA